MGHPDARRKECFGQKRYRRPGSEVPLLVIGGFIDQIRIQGIMSYSANDSENKGEDHEDWGSPVHSPLRLGRAITAPLSG